MNEILVNVVVPILTGLLAWFGNAYRNKQKKEHDILDNVQCIIDIQNKHIDRCEATLKEMEHAYKELSYRNDQKQEAIKRAHSCKVPSESCPVLIYDSQVSTYESCASCAYKKDAEE